MAVKAAARAECYWLCKTGCRIDGYGTIDLGEMANVQWAMVESVSPGDSKSTRKKLEALLQFLSAFSFGVSLLERRNEFTDVNKPSTLITSVLQ